MNKYRIVEYKDGTFEIQNFDSDIFVFEWGAILLNILFNFGWRYPSRYSSLEDAKCQFEKLVIAEIKLRNTKKIKRIIK